MERITVTTIQHSKQRYDTVGDYFKSKFGIEFRVSDLESWEEEFLVILHELVEYALVRKAGVSIAEIDAFDMAHEARGDAGEPGDHPLAPYRRMHFFATTIERLMAAELGVDWLKYEAKLDCLNQENKDDSERINRNTATSFGSLAGSKGRSY